ncbi:MAG TPA: hypothetical protein VF310_04695 [Vicinamibacteria bacterium]
MRPLGRAAGPLLAAAGLLALGRERRGARHWLPFVGALAFALAAWIGPRFSADSPAYYVYARSLLFDGDLDFADEWQHWGFKEEPLTATGKRQSLYAAGPAALWSPFILGAHAYVRALNLAGARGHTADGYSEPYFRAAALGTLVYAIAGAWLLGRTVARAWGGRVALLAVLGTIACSPAAYYFFVNPTMPHGLCFALAAVALWASAEIRAGEGTLATFVVLGAATGAVVAVRWQAFVFALRPAAVGLVALRRRSARPTWLLAGAGAALLAFSPQLLAWKALYGRWVWVPQNDVVRGQFTRFDWSAPRLLDVLLHADHGLFMWSPALLLALLGLVASLRRWGVIAAAGLAIFALTAYVNGSIGDWAGSHSFGARRFDVVLPFLALGAAAVLRRLQRTPLLGATALVGLAALWNVGLMRLAESGLVPDAAPWERVAAAQARQAGRLAEAGMGALFGEPGRALAYKARAGEYFYWNLNLSGTLDLASCDERYLLGEWSPPENREGPATFRWALHPRSCLRFPLERPVDLPTVITARAPGRLGEAQRMTVTLNGTALAAAALGREWQDVPVRLPASALRSGENLLCFEFAAGLPGDARAAAISRVQLP